MASINEIACVRNHSWLAWNSYIYNIWVICGCQKQMPKYLEIAANRWRVVVLSSKAAAHKSLIRDRNLSHMSDLWAAALELSTTTLHLLAAISRYFGICFLAPANYSYIVYIAISCKPRMIPHTSDFIDICQLG